MEFTYDSTTTVNRGCQPQLGDRGSFFAQKSWLESVLRNTRFVTDRFCGFSSPSRLTCYSQQGGELETNSLPRTVGDAP